MRIDEKIAIQLAHLQHQLTSNGPVGIGKEDYWELILTDSVRETYLVMAQEAVEMVRVDDAS
jgi:hypothetical protein